VDEQLFDLTHADGTRVRSAMDAEDRFLVLYFGRPGYAKGLDYLIDAIPEMADRIPHLLVLFLLADEPRKLYDAAMHRLHGLVERGVVQVKAPVARAELPNYLAAADCVVIPSLSEGFGLSAAEACAMGRPVVATTGGALPEVVSGWTIMVPPRDSPALAHAVYSISSGNVTQRRIRHFEWDHIIEKHLNIFATTQQGIMHVTVPRTL